MVVVEEYWSGVLQRLQAEVDVFNRLIAHSGEMGRENELSLARVLTSLIPQRYGVGSGMLIDSRDRYSSQTDIVIYNQADDPAILAQSTQVLFPIENVRACIEVKTRIGKEEIEDVAKKVKSVKDLENKRQVSPIYALVGYNAVLYPETIAKHLYGLPSASRPDLVLVLSQGMLAGRKSALSLTVDEEDPDYLCGLCCLHETDAAGERSSMIFAVPPDDFEEGTVEVRGVAYPVTQLVKNWFLAEPSRALLLFCEALLRGLAQQQRSAIPTLSHYLTSVAREMLIIK